MTANRDADRIVRAWLDLMPDEAPDRVIADVLLAVEATPQVRWWPARGLRRLTPMTRFAAIAAVVVLGAALFGAALLTGGGGRNSGPALVPAAPSPTPAPSPSPSPRPVPSDGDLSPIEGGTFLTQDPFLVPVTFTVPAVTVSGGWTAHLGGPYGVFQGPRSGADVLGFTIFNKVHADPCHAERGLLDPPPGPTAADLATALAGLPGLTATTPEDISLDGFTGKQITLTAPASFAGCSLAPDGYVFAELPLGAALDLQPGQRITLRIFDVDGQRLAIVEWDDTAQTNAVVQQVLDSISIAAPVTPSPSPSGG